MNAHAALPSWLPTRPLLELRIDVRLPLWGVEADLRRLQERMQRPGDPLSRLACLRLDLPGFAFRYRQADGEHYVYVEDLARGQLAGYTVFNRLVELSRQADPHVRAPHSRYARQYQRRGIASTVYRWALEGGMCLVTGPRQSAAAHALWHALARRHELAYVELKAKQLAWLGCEIAAERLDAFDTRMLLLGQGWTKQRFLHETGAECREPAPAAATQDAAGDPAPR